MNIDQTGFGYASAGWAPLPSQNQDAQRNKFHTERMADAMQYIDPYITQAVNKSVRAMVQNGSDPGEVRRAAFDSVSGQLMRDGFGAARQLGYLGSGNHINYGANIMQGVAGGGFSMNLLSPGGRTIGMGQQVNGNGVLAEQVSIQMAKDVMKNLYGGGAPDPAKLYGFNMEEASGVFNTLAQRGALGNAGALKRFGRDVNGNVMGVGDRLANARRQEVDPTILAGLEGVTAGNIDERIAQATKDGNKKVATALGDIKQSETMFVVDDKNTKRVTDITREVVKGLANLKDIYGELNSPQLLAQMEALSGIKITSSAEARKAATMTNNLRNAFEASGRDPRSAMDALASEGSVMNGIQRWNSHLGTDGRNDSSIQAIRAGFTTASASQAALLSRSAANTAARINAGGGDVSGQSYASMMDDNDRMVDAMVTQNPALIYGSGLANGQFRNDKEFGVAQRRAEEAFNNARSPGERRAAEQQVRKLMRSRGITFDDRFRNSLQGQDAVANADFARMTDIATSQGNVAANTQVTRDLLQQGGASTSETDAIERMLKSGIGMTGMQALREADGRPSGGKEIGDMLDSFVKNGEINAGESAAFRRVMLTKGGFLRDPSRFGGMINDIGGSRAGGRSDYERNRSTQQLMDAEALDQRSKLSDTDGLSIKSVINALMTGKSKGLTSETQKLAAIEAMQKENLAGDIDPVSTVDTRDGYSQAEMDQIRKSSGDKNFSLHDKLGFAGEKEMLSASASGKDSARVRKQIQTALQQSDKIMVGGTSDAMKILGTRNMDKVDEYARRFDAASKLRALSGLKAGEVTPAMTELMKTGKTSGEGAYTADSSYFLDDPTKNKGLWHSIRDASGFGDNTRANMKNAGRYINAAEETLGAGFDANKALNEATGGGLVKAMEVEVSTLRKARDAGALTLQTDDGKGGRVTKDLNEAMIKRMEEAISKLKEGSGDGKTIEEMHVTRLIVDNKEEK